VAVRFVVNDEIVDHHSLKILHSKVINKIGDILKKNSIWLLSLKRGLLYR
jgi:hypothetical protein